MIDNFNIITPLLQFDNKDEFYYLQLLQRKKDNVDIGSNSCVIKNYYITSVEQLISKKDEIVELCNTFNARASIRLNKRSFEKVAFKALVNIANSISNREFSFIRRSYDRACGNGHAQSPALWVLDVDDRGRNANDMILFIEQRCLPIGNKYKAFIPSLNGYHLITTPFNVEQFRKVYTDIEIHKDNPTNLYIPK